MTQNRRRAFQKSPTITDVKCWEKKVDFAIDRELYLAVENEKEIGVNFITTISFYNCNHEVKSHTFDLPNI